MAIIQRNVWSDGKREMNMQEFKQWLKRFDANKDGKISRSELRDAVRRSGGHFATFKARQGLKSADANHDGFIDENEFENLVEFAEKHLKVRVSQF